MAVAVEPSTTAAVLQTEQEEYAARTASSSRASSRQSSHLLPSLHSPESRNHRARLEFAKLADPQGCLPIDRVGGFLSQLSISSQGDYVSLAEQMAGDEGVLSLDKTLVLCNLIEHHNRAIDGAPEALRSRSNSRSATPTPPPPGTHSASPLPQLPPLPMAQLQQQQQAQQAHAQQLQPQQPQVVEAGSSSSPYPGELGQASSSADGLGAEPSTASSKAPLKKVLTKNRYYLDTGNLSYDQAVLQYIAKLDDHKRRCEGDGRYKEAQAAAQRLADLKTAQVQKLRNELTGKQQAELQEIHKVYEEETQKFFLVWEQRVREYEANFAKAVEGLRAEHGTQLQEFVGQIQARKPAAARPSREYLNERTRQKKLAKSGMYEQANKVKAAADELYQSDLQSTLAGWEADSKLRLARLTTRQQQEFEALLQRGARGRDELELRRVGETERRNLRFRNIIAELENLHKLEVVQLENWLDAQVQAGKAVPLKDASFRRKREQLLCSTL